MAARTSMAAIISAVRLLINDPAGDTPVFADGEIQDALDHVRVDVNYLELATKAHVNPGGTVLWLDYYALTGNQKLGDWEADAVLQGYPSFAVLSPITSDYLTGHWTFDTSIYTWGQRPPVYLTGKTYDRFAAAAELLEDWAAKLTLEFTFSSDSQKFMLEQQSANLLRQADRYKLRMRPRTLQMTRSDTPHTLWQRHNVDVSRSTF
jgi:hypothetical protein